MTLLLLLVVLLVVVTLLLVLPVKLRLLLVLALVPPLVRYRLQVLNRMVRLHQRNRTAHYHRPTFGVS
jgi:hypothetical protein